MNTSFTPGKWIMTEEGEDDLVVCSERGDFICAPSGTTFGEAIDNARLIAASPRMYQALEKCAELLADLRSGEYGPIDCDHEFDVATEALNLATGQEP